MNRQGYLLVLGLCVSSAAPCGNWYVGLGGGETDVGYSRPVPPATPEVLYFTSHSYEYDDSGTAGRIFGGYRFNDYFAVETGYTDMGELTEIREWYSEPTSTVTATTKIEVDGFAVSALGRYPLSKLVSVKGGAGIYEWDEATESNVTATLLGDDQDWSSSRGGNGTDWFYTIGLQVWQFSLEYRTYTLTRRSNDIDVDYTGLAWQYRF